MISLFLTLKANRVQKEQEYYFPSQRAYYPLNLKLLIIYQMLNDDTTSEQKGMRKEQEVQSQWVQIVSQVMEKVVSGTNMSTTIEFDDLEVDVPKAKGPDGRDLGSATWKLNGKVIWTTEAHKNQDSLQ